MGRALRRAGLAGDWDREAAEDVERGPGAVLGGVVESFEDLRPVCRVDVDVALRPGVEFPQHAAGGVVDFLAEVRGDDRAAVASVA